MVEETEIPNEHSIPATSIEEIMREYNLERIDILKIDIEGSEIEVFENNTQFWLSRTRLMIIDLHDGMRRGASKSVCNAIQDYDFGMELKGENLIF